MIDVVNAIFRELIVAEPESQPDYVALEPVRAGCRSGPRSTLLGAEPDAEATSADELRELEAADVAAVVRRALREGWSVVRRTGSADGDGNERTEPCRLGDLCILLPARTSLGHLEDALDAAGIPYRAETSSLVYSTREIRDLLVVLQAVDDPTDELALVSALRSPIFGCGDDDLYTFKVEHGGRWDHQRTASRDAPVRPPVADAMRALAEWHDARYWSSPSELLDRIVRERRVLEVGFAHGRPRDLWRRVRFVIEQARAFADAEGGSVRDFLAWADLQGSEGARVVETVLPETDDDAVRILTIHGAKGLEFPITIVSGMTTKAAGHRPGVQSSRSRTTATPTRCASRKRVTTEEFERYAPIDEQMDFHEKLRLLYVAMTRARDHLVVSVHRPAKAPGDDQTSGPTPSWCGTQPPTNPGGSRSPPPPTTSDPLERADDAAAFTASPPPPWDDWLAARDAARAASARRRVRSATALARDAEAARRARRPGAGQGTARPRVARRGTRAATAPHSGGRCTRCCRPSTSPPGPASTTPPPRRPQPKGSSVVRTTSRRVHASRSTTRVVREAVAHGFRREMYVATPVDGTTLEGYVDLVYRRPDGLVVVDYKTDAWADDADLDGKVARYRLQGAAYAVALEQATGEPVAECVFVFLGGDGATRDVGQRSAGGDG